MGNGQAAIPSLPPLPVLRILSTHGCMPDVLLKLPGPGPELHCQPRET